MGFNSAFKGLNTFPTIGLHTNSPSIIKIATKSCLKVCLGGKKKQQKRQINGIRKENCRI
jgi:hypothetical protein